MNLSQLQDGWQWYILNGQLNPLQAWISGGSPKERLEIYADAYEARLLEAMEKIFPCLEKQAGEERFYQYCVAYFKQCPSNHYSLAHIGHQFSEFLQRYNTMFAEIALFEWVIYQAVDAPNATPINQKMLMQIRPEKWSEMIFSLHPSVAIVSFKHDVPEIIKNKNKNKKNLYYRIWRKNLQVYYLPMTKTEYIFLRYIQDKLPFGLICEKLLDQADISEEKIVDYAVSCIMRWLSDEMIIATSV